MQRVTSFASGIIDYHRGWMQYFNDPDLSSAYLRGRLFAQRHIGKRKKAQ